MSENPKETDGLPTAEALMCESVCESQQDSAQPAASSGERRLNGEAVDGSVEPAAESPADAEIVRSDVTERVRDALSELAARPARDPVTQRFVGANVGAGTTLARSAQFWSAVEPAKRELVERVRTDLAVDDSSVETLLGLIEGYCEARLFRTSMFLRLVDQGGPITTKGKARALYRAYLDALDRETKLAQVLGLERKSKRIDLAQAFAEQERARG